jgi:hypothetical protein
MIVVAVLLALTGCGGDATEEAAPETPAIDDAAVNEARYNCLLDKGFAVTRGERGEVVFQDPEDTQIAAWNDANRDCDAELVAAGLLVAESTDDLRAEYRAMSALHACLVDAGFSLVDWPTEDVFVQEEGAFNVLDATAPVDPEEAREACPDEFETLESS